MPLLFSLGQHRAMVAVQASLLGSTIVCLFGRHLHRLCAVQGGEVYLLLQRHLLEQTGIQVHQGKTKIWNAGGLKPPVADVLTARARVNHPEAVVWRGDPTLDVSRQGLNVLGVPVGHPQYVAAQLHQKGQEQALLFERIPHVDVQIAWLLLTFCAATRANYWLRTARIEGSMTAGCSNVCATCCTFATDFLDRFWRPLRCHSHWGCLGVGGSSRVRDAAFWGSFADCLEIVKARHPQVAQVFAARDQGVSLL